MYRGRLYQVVMFNPHHLVLSPPRFRGRTSLASDPLQSTLVRRCRGGDCMGMLTAQTERGLERRMSALSVASLELRQLCGYTAGKQHSSLLLHPPLNISPSRLMGYHCLGWARHARR